MGDTNDPPLIDRHMSAGLNTLILMAAGTFALLVQNLRDLTCMLGVCPTRAALIVLACSAALASVARVLCSIGLTAVAEDDTNRVKLALAILACVILTLLFYAAFVVIVVWNLRAVPV